MANKDKLIRIEYRFENDEYRIYPVKYRESLELRKVAEAYNVLRRSGDERTKHIVTDIIVDYVFEDML